MNMLAEFILKKLKTTRCKKLEDGTYFGHIPSIPGIWSNARRLKECRLELQEVFEEWLVLEIRDRQKISGLDMAISRRSMARC